LVIKERPMQKRWLLRFRFFLFLSVAGVVFALWLTRPIDHVNQDSYGKLQIGMTRQDVEEILGGGPGDYGASVWDFPTCNFSHTYLS